eukprot:4742319-Pyramimonas_sp.AAC.1
MQTKAFEDWALPGDGTLEFYTHNATARLLFRRRLNARFQNAARRSHVKSILTDGNIMGVRGAPWAVNGENGSCALLSFGIYRTAKTDRFLMG